MSSKFPVRSWPEVSERVARCTFRIYTDESMGTGFLIMLGKSAKGFHGVFATAWHVIEPGENGLALRICDQNGNEIVRSSGSNMQGMQIGDGLDSAIVIVHSEKKIWSEEILLPILPNKNMLARGASIGWLGYPGITEPELCFFRGSISGYFSDPPVYLVDGVAINGVSGGPVFDDRCHLVGLVSAYLPNRVSEFVTLPGVSMMVPINFIHGWVINYLNPEVRTV